MNLLMADDSYEIRSNLDIYWEYVDIVGYQNLNTPIEVTGENCFTIQIVDSIEQVRDNLFTIKGYSLKELGRNRIRLFKITVKYAQLRDGKWFALPYDAGKFTVVETMWEKDREA